MSLVDAEVEDELRKLGARRRRLRRQQKKLREDTETVVKRVPNTGISIARACDLAEISRSSAYDEFL